MQDNKVPLMEWIHMLQDGGSGNAGPEGKLSDRGVRQVVPPES
jgi:hypothetical protein